MANPTITQAKITNGNLVLICGNAQYTWPLPNGTLPLNMPVTQIQFTESSVVLISGTNQLAAPFLLRSVLGAPSNSTS